MIDHVIFNNGRLRVAWEMALEDLSERSTARFRIMKKEYFGGHSLFLIPRRAHDADPATLISHWTNQNHGGYRNVAISAPGHPKISSGDQNSRIALGTVYLPRPEIGSKYDRRPACPRLRH